MLFPSTRKVFVLPPPSTAAERLPSLTGLRFAAALLVFGVHAYSFVKLASPQDQRIAQVLFDGGDLGVSFFFVLSGFVLTWSARPGRGVLAFWRGRVARVYPAHLVALLFTVICLAITDRIPAIFRGLLVSVALLVQAWHPDDSVYLGLNPVTWSLSCEMAFYLCFPLLYAAACRMRARGLYALTAGLVAAVWLMPVVADLAVPAEHRRWFVYIFPLTRMAEFALGIVVARLVRLDAWRGPGLLLATVIWAGNYLAVDWLPAQTRDTAGTVVATALIIPAAALADLRGTRSFWRDRLAVHLGEVSYAFFLVHLVVIVTAMQLIGRDTRWSAPYAVAITATLLLLSYVLAVLLHSYVELPAMRLLTRRRAAPRVRPAVADEPAPAVAAEHAG